MSDRPVPHVWQYATATAWAMLPERLAGILEIAARENLDVEAVAAKLGRPLDNSRATSVRDGVAIIPVEGVIFPRASLFAAISGGVAADDLAADLHQALADPGIAGIALLVDSPGGDVNGVAEVAQMIFAARDAKPIVAYVRDLGASAAYWLAAAASEVVVASTALVGSIGIIGTVPDPAKQSSRSVEFVSSQSPHKRPDPTTAKGAERIQARVDELAAIFIADVARFRGVSPERVAADFGQGDVLVGQQAVDAGLADRVGSFEGVIADLQAKAREPRRMMSGGRMAAQHREGAMAQQEPKTGRMEKFFSWLAGEGDDSAFAGANIAASGQPAPTPAPVALPVTLASAPDPEVEAMRAELARLKGEARAGIPAAAAAFAEAEIVAGRALPAERDALVGAYTGAAEDDADFPRAGQPTRVARLAERQAARPAHALTAELVPLRPNRDGTLTPLASRETTRTEGADPELTADRWREQRAFTAAGRAFLAANDIPATGPLTAAHREKIAALAAATHITIAG